MVVAVVHVAPVLSALLLQQPCQQQQVLSFVVGYLMSQQHTSVSQGWITGENFASCHSEIEVADQT